MSKISRKLFIVLVAILTLVVFSNEASAETLDPLKDDTIEQASVPPNMPYRIWQESWLSTSASFPERTQFVTKFYYGVGYRGHLTITRRTDGQSGALYTGWLYHPNYSGGNLPVPARIIGEEK